MLMPKESKIVVFDSADFQQKSYQDFIDVIQKAYRWYIIKGGVHDANKPDKMTVRTNFPVITHF